MPIKRADGTNESERYLKRLCDQTFLSLWSYPNVHSDEGLVRNKQGEEVCDLLVVFENHIIIFSDKDCQFPNSGSLAVDWKRWIKRSIKKSVRQLKGAERWIKKYPNRLFLSEFCTQRFPLHIPDEKTAKFHLIAVTHNSFERCRQELGGNGSLKITIRPKGAAYHISDWENSPFYIGDIDPSQTFVHILDDISLDLVLATLDTVSDFVAYLTKKEKLFRSGLQISAASELELLAYYHKFINSAGERDFLILQNLTEQKEELTLEEGYWEEFEQSSERKAKLEEDLISYQWDKIIEKISYYCLQEKLYFTSHESISEQEILFRLLARENRFYRRILSEALYDLVYSSSTNEVITRYIKLLRSEAMCYVFMVFPHFVEVTYQQYREERRLTLHERCYIAKQRFPDIQHVVGIATEPNVLGKEGRSEDIIYLDVTDWTSEDEIQVRKIDEKRKMVQDLNVSLLHYDEYPSE
jgi:hypothetical protein